MQAQRNGQLSALMQATHQAQGYVAVEHVVVGAGQGAVMDVATLQRNRNVPGAAITEIPSVINIAPQDTMFAAHTFPIGQRPQEFPDSAAFRWHPAELQADRSGYLESQNLVRALTLTAYESGLVTYRARVVGYELRGAQADAAWPADKPHKLTLSDGVVVYAARVDLSTGLGPPRNFGGPGKSASQVALEQTGRLVHAQEALQLPPSLGAQRVAVIGNGASGAWAVRGSLAQGVKEIVWLALPGKSAQVDVTTREGMLKAGIPETKVASFDRGWNECNQPAYDAIKSGKVKLEVVTDTTPALSADGQQVEVGGRRFDGVISAIGSVPEPIPGTEQLWYRQVLVDDATVPDGVRVVALEAVDAQGQPLGIRKIGTEMVTVPSVRIVEMRTPDNGIRSKGDADAGASFLKRIKLQAEASDVPANSQGVQGSLHQNMLDIPEANK